MQQGQKVNLLNEKQTETEAHLVEGSLNTKVCDIYFLQTTNFVLGRPPAPHVKGQIIEAVSERHLLWTCQQTVTSAVITRVVWTTAITANNELVQWQMPVLYGT